MNIKNISIPEIYRESSDFRFFIDWFATALSKIQFDIENIYDLYDPLKCKEELLWMLADTIGFKYDDRVPTAMNRLILIYFMSMIYNRGCRDGVTLAAEINLAQFRISESGKSDDILYNRLEDTSIPVNSAYVTPHTEDGYIDVVYFSTKIPIDACIEYVRPVGMFLFQHAGVRYDARTKIHIDARLTNTEDIGMSFGPTFVGHYRREDYTRLQKTINSKSNESHTRQNVWSRNSTYEDIKNGDGTYGSGTQDSDVINPGYRALSSLQLSNNEEIVKSLIDPIFSIGYGPQDVSVSYPDDYITNLRDIPELNLRYDRDLDEHHTLRIDSTHFGIMTLDPERTTDIMHPNPAVNPVMSQLGDSISLNSENTKYTNN